MNVEQTGLASPWWIVVQSAKGTSFFAGRGTQAEADAVCAQMVADLTAQRDEENEALARQSIPQLHGVPVHKRRVSSVAIPIYTVVSQEQLGVRVIAEVAETPEGIESGYRVNGGELVEGSDAWLTVRPIVDLWRGRQ